MSNYFPVPHLALGRNSDLYRWESSAFALGRLCLASLHGTRGLCSKKLASSVERLICPMYGSLQSRSGRNRRIGGVKASRLSDISGSHTRAITRSTVKPVRDRVPRGPTTSKRRKVADLCRSGEGQIRLGTTDVFLRVHYVADSYPTSSPFCPFPLIEYTCLLSECSDLLMTFSNPVSLF